MHNLSQVDQLKSVLVIEMAISEKLLKKLMISKYKLSCSANCTNSRGNCKEKRVTLEKARYTLVLPSSLIQLSLDMGRNNNARCRGLTEFFEPYQKPLIIFERTGAKTGQLVSFLISATMHPLRGASGKLVYKSMRSFR